jgi:hydroxymethylpyrimidine/phosphomethylpyrimidine kinase
LNSAPARLLIIAGSDSSGGAGIQADIKTATALGVYAMTAITAVTAQDMAHVRAIHLVPGSLVRDQINCVLDGIGADAIKIGMLGSCGTAEIVADVLAARNAVPVVLDPVLVSTGGTALLELDAIDVITSRLFPLATIVTPNLPEAERLTGIDVDSEAQLMRAAGRLREFGAAAILVKGGHAEGDRVRDILVEENAPKIFEAPRLARGSVRGTGCTLSTAIACGLARHLSLSDAVLQAHNYVHAAIETAPDFGGGDRPLNHMHNIYRD